MVNDTISRHAAIDALIRKMRPHNNGDGTMTICIMTEGLVRETLNTLPSAQPNTPTVTYGLGKWIEKEEEGYHGGGYTECSVCGQRYSWGGYFEANGFRYCPRCGHRMEAQE